MTTYIVDSTEYLFNTIVPSNVVVQSNAVISLRFLILKNLSYPLMKETLNRRTALI